MYSEWADAFRAIAVFRVTLRNGRRGKGLTDSGLFKLLLKVTPFLRVRGRSKTDYAFPDVTAIGRPRTPHRGGVFIIVRGVLRTVLRVNTIQLQTALGKSLWRPRTRDPGGRTEAVYGVRSSGFRCDFATRSVNKKKKEIIFFSFSRVLNFFPLTRRWVWGKKLPSRKSPHETPTPVNSCYNTCRISVNSRC